jgi:hypothetical protein
MTKRQTTYFSDAALQVIGDTDRLSTRVNSIIIRAGNILRAECPELTAEDWLLICHVLRGRELVQVEEDDQQARLLWAEIATGRAHDPQSVALSNCVQAMSYAQVCAILDVITRFWALGDPDSHPIEALRAAGAKGA